MATTTTFDTTHARIGTGSKAIELVTVQPQGKKPMAGADWARGVRITADDQLGSE